MIRDQIKNARRSAGLTQAQLADKINVGLATLQRIESGQSSPDVATLESLSNALGITFHIGRVDYVARRIADNERFLQNIKALWELGNLEQAYEQCELLNQAANLLRQEVDGIWAESKR